MSRLWRQLLVLWGAGAVLTIVLLALDGSLTGRGFFWLVPYPSDLRTVWMSFVGFFHYRPMLATAVAVIPTVMVATVVLVAARTVTVLRRRGDR